MMADQHPAATPEPRPFNIQPAESEDDAYFLNRWYHHWFGVTHDYWEPRLSAAPAQLLGWCEEYPAVQGVVATHGPVRVGGGLVAEFTPEQVRDELPEGRFEADALIGETNGWLLCGVVDPAWQGYGLGCRLFEHRLDWLAQRDVEMVFGYGWERDGPSSRPLFEGYGFQPIQCFEYTSEPRSACPDCRAWPSNDTECSCEFTLWALDGDQIESEVTA
jgi:GNAT superfamily N-acetyltransferase